MAEPFNTDPKLATEEENPLKNIDLRRFLLVVIQRWRFIAAFSLFFLIIGITGALYLRGRAYTATAVILRSAPAKGVVMGEGAHFELPATNIDTLVDTIKLPSNLIEIKKRIEVEGDIHDLAGKITLSRASNSNLINISGTLDSPEKAVKLANVTAQVFAEYLLNLRRRQAKEALEKIDILVEQAQKKYSETSEKLSEFRKKHGIVKLDVETDLSLQKESELKGEIENARVELIALNQQLRSLDTDNVRIGQLSENSTGGQQMRELQSQLDELRSRYTDDNPIIAKQKAEINAVYKTIALEEKSRLTAQRSAAASRLRNFQQQLENMQGKLKKLSENEKGFLTIQQDYIFAKQALGDLSARREEAAAITREPLGEFRIIEQAVPPKYPETSKAKLVAAAMPILGLMFALFVILAQEFFNRRLKSAKEIYNRYDLPILGQHLHDPLAPLDAPHREVNMYRPIVSTLSVEKRFQGKKTLAFFAPTTSSGLTTVTRNLAEAFAKRGRKVLYADFSLHPENTAPPLLLEELKKNDFSENLIRRGQDGAPDQLFAGLRNATDLDVFSNNRLVGLIEQLQQQYDLVLIDTPPAFEFVQVIELVPLVEAVILVFRSGTTKMDQAERIVRQYRSLQSPLLGAFIADATPFLVRKQEIAIANSYRKVRLGRGFVENFLLEKFMS